MIKLNYNLSQKKLECNYMRVLFSTKFGKGKNAKSVKKKFDELKLKYPFDVIFFDISFVDIIFVKPENLRCLINKIELRIIEQSKIKHKEIKKKKTFIYDVKDELKKIFKYENKFQSPISKFFEKSLETRTCYFCNIHFVNEYKVGKSEFKNELNFRNVRFNDYAVFNNTGFKLGILGSSHGRGMAVNNLTGEKVYMKMKEYQAGLGLGIKEYAIIFVFTDSDSLNSFVQKGWSFGAQATAVADDGISGGALEGAIHVDNGVWMYQMTTKGLAAELAVKGTNYYRDKNLN